MRQLSRVGDRLNVVENQAEKDLERFTAFIEAEGYATGAWRGSVGAGTSAGTPGVEDAAASRGDSGKAGVSAKAVAAGVGLAAAGVAAAAATRKDDATDDVVREYDEVTPVVADDAVVTPAADDVGLGGTAAPTAGTYRETDDGTDPAARI